jgi:hypothetical protein
MIKLKEGQKLIGEDGNTYLIERGDVIQEKLLKEGPDPFSQLWGNVYREKDWSHFLYFNGYEHSIEVLDKRNTIYMDFHIKKPLSDAELYELGITKGED